MVVHAECFQEMKPIIVFVYFVSANDERGMGSNYC